MSPPAVLLNRSTLKGGPSPGPLRACACVCLGMWTVEDSLGFRSSLLLIIETVLELTEQAGWLESPRDPPVSGSPLLGIRGQATMPGFFIFWG